MVRENDSILRWPFWRQGSISQLFCHEVPNNCAISVFLASSGIILIRQSPQDLPCSGEEVVLQCTLPGQFNYWQFPGGEETVALGGTEQVTGNFRARPVNVVNGNFTSILTFSAESRMVITCINEDRSMNTSYEVTVQGTQWYINYCRVSLNESRSTVCNMYMLDVHVLLI